MIFYQYLSCYSGIRIYTRNFFINITDVAIVRVETPVILAYKKIVYYVFATVTVIQF